MYKCYDCNALYPTPKGNYFHTGAQGAAVNNCDCGGPLAPAQQCPYCGEWFLVGDAYTAGWCHTCAQSVYTPVLGLRFIEENKYEKNFVSYCYNILFCRNAGDTAKDILFQAARQAIKSDAEWGRTGAQSIALKEFCLEDMDEWVDFLTYCEGENTTFATAV